MARTSMFKRRARSSMACCAARCERSSVGGLAGVVTGNGVGVMMDEVGVANGEVSTGGTHALSSQSISRPAKRHLNFICDPP